jgi:hypothetical protein
MQAEWGACGMFNCLAAPEDFSASGMKALLINQFIDGRTLDEGRVELYQWFRPKESPIQARGNELL